jgi:hypothetical protein
MTSAVRYLIADDRDIFSLVVDFYRKQALFTSSKTPADGPFDLVIRDRMVPDEDGFSLRGRFQRSPASQNRNWRLR